MSVAFSGKPVLLSKRAMKFLLSLSLVSLLAASAMADIQDPPMNDNGPTRKLGRAFGNILFGITELPSTVVKINEREGNSTAASYGVVKGVGRMFYRLHKGIYELFTFPFPTHQGSYRASYKSNIPWIHGGFEEFPPELGFDTKYRYSRNYHGW
jgi:putative exosortase-associated protein (TIGR04073 family)